MRTVTTLVGNWGLAVALGTAMTACDTPSGPSPQSCEFAIAPAAFTPCMLPTELTATVSTAAGCGWTAAPGAGWITLASGAAGNGPGSIRLSVSENWDASRAGVVIIRNADSARVAEIAVAQAGCRYFVVPASLTVPGAGGPGTFEVIQQSEPLTCGGPLQNACRWSAQTTASWITILTPMPRTGDDRVFFEAAPHDGSVARSGQITVRDQVVLIVQAPR